MSLSRKSKVIAISVLLIVAILAVVTFLALYYTLPTSTNLTEVKLERNETLTYRMVQNVEVNLGELQKGTLHATVGIRVLNKTSDGYWFLMKFNVSHVGGNVDIGRDVQMRTNYFVVRLQRLDSRTANNGTGRSVELYGNYSTSEEQVLLVFGILEQLLPSLKRNLYEDVDGIKGAGLNSIHPEESLVLPRPVRMHREASTSDKDIIRIRNHFNNSDFTNTSSEFDVDMNMTYSDFASVNKSSGMILESSSHFYTELNLGEFIDNNGGLNDTISTIMKVNLTRHLWLVETENFDILKINPNVFVKLKVSKAPTFSLNETEKFPYNATNSSEIPTNVSAPIQQHNSTNSSITSLKRVRRANDVDNKIIREIWTKTEPLYLGAEKTFALFLKKVLGLKVKGSAIFSVRVGSEGLKEVGVSFKLSIGGRNLPAILSVKYSRSQLQGKPVRFGHQWQIRMSVSVPVHALRIGVDFGLKVKVNIKLSFPPAKNSLNPVKLTVQIEPYSEVTARIEGYISAHAIRAGAYGEGTLVRVGLPVTLSYCDKRWCITLCLSLKALELKAGIFYQWWNVWKWDWGKRRTIHDFGKWAALKKNLKLFNKCTALPSPKTDPSPNPNPDPDPKPNLTSTTATSTTLSTTPSMPPSNSSVTRAETTANTITTTSVLTTTVTVCVSSPSYIFTLAERPNVTTSSLTNASSMEGKSRKFTTTSKASASSLEVIPAVTSMEGKLSIATEGMTLQATTPLPKTKTTTDLGTRTEVNTLGTETTAVSNSPSTTPGTTTMETKAVSSSTASVPTSLLKATPTTTVIEDKPTANTSATEDSTTQTKITPTTQTQTMASSFTSAKILPLSTDITTTTSQIRESGTNFYPTITAASARIKTTSSLMMAIMQKNTSAISGEATSAQGLPNLTVSARTPVTVIQVTMMDTAKASVIYTATSTPLSKVSYPSTVVTPNKPVTMTNTEGIPQSAASVITITSAVASETTKTSSTKTLDIGSTKSATPTATSSTRTTAILTIKGTAAIPSTVLTVATAGSTATEIIPLAPTTAYRSENMPSIVSDSLATTISSEASTVIKTTTSRNADASTPERTFKLTTSATATTPAQEVPPTFPLDAGAQLLD